VEVIRNSDDTVIASGATDADGFFCVDFGFPHTIAYVRVSAKTNHPDYNLRVKNLNDTFIYSVSSDVFNDDIDGNQITRDLSATVNAGVAGAFKILDVFEFGVDFSTQLTGIPQPLPLRGLWTPGVEPGTGFAVDPNGAFIQVNGGVGPAGNPDEYDDGILLHAFGHYMAKVYSKDASPGGPHSLIDNTQDIRLSFSEGWASFISGAMRGDRFIVDVVGGNPPNNAVNLILDLESTPAGVKDLLVYTTNELAVAKTLWDIFDNNTVNEFFDEIGTGITPIWDVMRNYFPQSSVKAASMEDFWEGWFVRGHNSLTEMLAITQEFKMDFFEDFFESQNGGDDSPNSQRVFIVNSPPEEHTLYPDGDVDYVAFNAIEGETYTIETQGLTNGADTFLEVRDINGVVLVSNDNRDGQTYSSSCAVVNCPPNDATTLSSLVDFTAPQSSLFYIRITHSPDAPPSAGRLGSYGFSITSTPATTTTIFLDTSPPSQIMDFTASDKEKKKSTLNWTNPSDNNLGKVVVVRKTGAYPSSHTDGTIVFDDTSPISRASVIFTDTGLTKKTTYYYAVYSRGIDGNWNDITTIGKNADTGRTR